MRCSSCSAPITVGQKFCRKCGTAVAEPPAPVAEVADADEAESSLQCPSCERRWELGVRFCRHCGAALPQSAGADTAGEGAAAPGAERAANATAAEPGANATGAERGPNQTVSEPLVTTATVVEPAAKRTPAAAATSRASRGNPRRVAVVLGAVAVMLAGAAGAYVFLSRDGGAPHATARAGASTSPAVTTTPVNGDDGGAPTTTVAPVDTTPTTAVAPADNTTTTTPPANTTSPATAPENTMRRHLEALAHHQYGAAFAEFSAGPGGSTESSWEANGRRYDARLAIGDIKEVGRSGGAAQVQVSFYSHDLGGAPGATGAHRCAWFHGTVYVVDRGGRWLYEPQSLGRTDLKKDFIAADDARCAPLVP
jgi:hypothetical protein